MKREIDIVVISDVHLGTYGCHAKELHNYLSCIKVGTLILNGDFVDMWAFSKRYFPKEHMKVINKILKMAERGTKVYYITGNHDDVLRKYTDFTTGNIHLRDKLLLNLKGKQHWIFHGDVFDLSIRYSRFIAQLGGKSYDYLIRLNRFVNRVRETLGLQPVSLAKRIKSKVKGAVRFISDFEETAIDLAAKSGYDYVVCGHIHQPQMRASEAHGQKVTYLNSGDWVESLTALEYNWGQWSIYQYDEADYKVVSSKLKVKQSDANSLDLDEEDALNDHSLLSQIMGGTTKPKEAPPEQEGTGVSSNLSTAGRK